MKYIQDIKNYIPVNEQESKDKEIIIDFINKNEDVLTRENEVAHLTSSGFIVNKNRDLLIFLISKSFLNNYTLKVFKIYT